MKLSLQPILCIVLVTTLLSSVSSARADDKGWRAFDPLNSYLVGDKPEPTKKKIANPKRKFAAPTQPVTRPSLAGPNRSPAVVPPENTWEKQLPARVRENHRRRVREALAPLQHTLATGLNSQVLNDLANVSNTALILDIRNRFCKKENITPTDPEHYRELETALLAYDFESGSNLFGIFRDSRKQISFLCSDPGTLPGVVTETASTLNKNIQEISEATKGAASPPIKLYAEEFQEYLPQPPTAEQIMAMPAE